jgi:hypothetical protein
MQLHTRSLFTRTCHTFEASTSCMPAERCASSGKPRRPHSDAQLIEAKNVNQAACKLMVCRQLLPVATSMQAIEVCLCPK